MSALSAAGPTLGVSLYSYGGDFLVTMSLEDCLADIADMGARDVEILADTHIPGYPTPAPEWVEHWHGLLERLELVPSCYSSWLDTRLHRGRPLAIEEAEGILRRDLDLAHRLGFRVLRPKIGVVSLDLAPDPIWREAVLRVLELAERHAIRIAPEIHAPTPLRSRVVEDYLAFVRETGTEWFGLLVDTGIFQRTERAGADGDAVYAFGDPDPALREQVDREMRRPLAVEPRELADVLPHVVHVHAKFWDIDDALTDSHVPYPEIVAVLVEGGYAGSISSEYEGPRDPYRASDMLRRQQAMLRRLLARGGRDG